MSIRERVNSAVSWISGLPSIPELGRYLGWARRGTWAVVDQGLFSAGNFLLNILLARWMTAQGYGAFSLVYAILYLLITIHKALYADPMLVFGAGKYGEGFDGYFRSLLVSQVVLTLALSIVVGATVMLTVSSALIAESMLGLAFATPFVLVLWLVRRAFYVRSQPGMAVILSSLYLVSMGLGIFAIFKGDAVSPLSAMLVVGGAALVSSTLLLPQFPLRGTQFSSGSEGPSLRQILKDHWDFGLPASGSVIARWGQDNLPYLVLPLTAGLEAAGAFRAVMNFILPSRQVMNALYNVLVPSLSRRWQQIKSHTPEFRKPVARISIVMVLIGAAYGAALVVFRGGLFTLLYGGQYQAYADLLFLAAILAPAYGALTASTSALVAMDRPDQVFVVFGVGMGILVVAGVPLMTLYDVTGAILILALSTLAATAISWSFTRRSISS